MNQNWNNLLSFIKQRLGIKNNFIELSDIEIIQYIKEHSLPFISDYVPNKNWFLLSPNNKKDDSFSNYTYIIPDEHIDNLKEISAIYYENTNVFGFSSTSNLSANSPLNFYTGDIPSIFMANTFKQLIDTMLPVKTFFYYRPNILKLNLEITNPLIVEAYYHHSDLETLPSDIYLFFKKIALRDIIQLITMNRSKYSSLTTPFTNIDMNIDRLDTLADKLSSEIDTYLTQLPLLNIHTYLDI